MLSSHLVASWPAQPVSRSRELLDGVLGNPSVILAGFNDPLTATGGIGTVMRGLERRLGPRFHLVFWNPQRDREREPSGRWLWPVALPGDVVRDFQRTFLKRYVWPALHGLSPPVCGPQVERLRGGVVRAASAFGDAIVALADALPAERPIVVWLNDYAMAWCVSQVRSRLGDRARIGVSIRSAFGLSAAPTLEADDAAALVHNLLLADFVTFHRVKDVANCLAMVAEVLQLPQSGIVRSGGRIEYQGRITHLRAVPMGNDPDDVDQLAADDRTSDMIADFERLVSGATIVASVSRLEPHKGIGRELEMIEEVLTRNPRLIGRCSLVRLMPISPEYAALPEYVALRDGILQKAERINQRFATSSWRPVHLLSDRVFDRRQVMALFRAASVVVVLSHADGFSHVPLEAFMAKRPGDVCPVIVSSDVGVADYLSDALVSVDEEASSEQLGERLVHALEMSDVEKRRRFEVGVTRARTLTVDRWAVSALTGMLRTDLLPQMRWDVS
jgi:trehalose-6-phosphate synthase